MHRESVGTTPPTRVGSPPQTSQSTRVIDTVLDLGGLPEQTRRKKRTNLKLGGEPPSLSVANAPTRRVQSNEGNMTTIDFLDHQSLTFYFPDTIESMGRSAIGIEHYLQIRRSENAIAVELPETPPSFLDSIAAPQSTASQSNMSLNDK